MLLPLDTEALWSYRGSREYKETSRPCRPVVLQTGSAAESPGRAGWHSDCSTPCVSDRNRPEVGSRITLWVLLPAHWPSLGQHRVFARGGTMTPSHLDPRAWYSGWHPINSCWMNAHYNFHFQKQFYYLLSTLAAGILYTHSFKITTHVKGMRAHDLKGLYSSIKSIPIIDTSNTIFPYTIGTVRSLSLCHWGGTRQLTYPDDPEEKPYFSKISQFISRILMQKNVFFFHQDKNLPGGNTNICVHTGNPEMASVMALPGVRNLGTKGASALPHRLKYY